MISNYRIACLILAMAGLCQTSYGQPFPNRKYGQEDKFRQLEEILPTPNSYRSASGEPGPDYWQQRVDYTIDVRLDESDHSIHGSETIRYRNQSPHTLRYLWVQLDPNIFAQDSDANRTRSGRIGFGNRASMAELDSILERTQRFDGRCMIESVTDALGKGLDIFTVDTMMRIDLPEPLLSGQEFSLKIQWSYLINNSKLIGGRTGYEPFEKDGNAIYEIAQWFPRLAAFTDVTGWQHKQYLGQGEFTLEFGDYLVRITAPADHIVAATGELQNPNEVLSDVQRERLEQARTADRPVLIVTPEEAKENEKEKTDQLKTWIFRAEAVRDFAFATSRKFIWDAQGHRVNDNSVMAMSYYPNEGNPLWSKYSTHAIIHTLNVYSRYTFDYPYPVAISVNGPVGGMEYPMICFNGPRPKEDGTYSASTKYDLITVIIHEVGHNYFPMIVNSDERQWSWMDEGLNTFLQYLAEQEWEQDYPSQRGEPELIVPYMQSTNQVPIMTNSDSIMQFGPNAYSKPATALNILRETILGRELFDFAFKEYARRWKFKRPMPADFFRTMEDATARDLDWFWRGWFYTTDHVDIALEKIDVYMVDRRTPDEIAADEKAKREAQLPTLSKSRNKDLPKRADQFPELKDFYNEYDPRAVTDQQRAAYQKALEQLNEHEKELLANTDRFYRLQFKNVGGLVMPVIVLLTLEDGSTKEVRLPAEVWRVDANLCDTLVVTEQPIVKFELDPYRETADINRDNNHFPPAIEPTRFQLFKSQRRGSEDNPMAQAKRAKEAQESQEKKQEGSQAKPSEQKNSQPESSGDSITPKKKDKKNRKRKQAIPGA
ncbi:MAG: M1 family metallopeptidase [Planctomycetota bacterium]